MRYRVTAPVEGFDGVLAGVVFSGGHADMDSQADAAALSYCRRRGYRVDPVPEAPQGEPKRPAKPKKSV